MLMTSSSASVRWAFNVKEWKPTKDQWKLCMQCVQKEEKERCNRFAFKEDCKSSMVGHLLMRKVINESLNLQYDKILFARTSAGKPYLVKEKGEDFYFNVSHNGDFCVLASEQCFTVGIDAMKVQLRGNRSIPEFFNLMKRQFSVSEWNFITMPGLETEQLKRFFRIWCLKESYVKAIGTGIACDLQTLSFTCQTSDLKHNMITTDTKLFINEQLQNIWNFEETYLDANHCVAVALGALHQQQKKSSHVLQNFTILTFQDLMKNCIPFEKLDQDFWENFTSKCEKLKI